MDAAKYPAPDAANPQSYRLVTARAIPAASPNFAPVYCLVTTEVDGFPIQQAIPLIPVSGAVQNVQPVPMMQAVQPVQAVQPAPPAPAATPSAASARPNPPQLPLPKSRIPTQWEISSLLAHLGVPARLSGFYYLVDAILYLLRQPIETRCMTMEVYPTVARRYSTSALAVEHAIRTAINQSWQEQNIPVYCAMSGRNPAPNEPKPTTCEFVANVLMFLRIHLAELEK